MYSGWEKRGVHILPETASVMLREEGYLVDVPIGGFESSCVDKQFSEKWQRILDLISDLFEVPSALIMKINGLDIEVFQKSGNVNNPYGKNDKSQLPMGLYCETVLGRDAELEIIDSLNSPQWKANPDVQLNMISYLGYPVKWPDGKFFGTICVLDSAPREFNRTLKKLLIQFRDALEKDLSLFIINDELKRSIELQGKYHDRIVHLESKTMADRLVSEFAHEISTPIGIAVTSASYLENECENLTGKKPDGLLRDAMGLINRNLQNAVKIVTSFRKLASDEERGVKQLFNVSESLQSVFLAMKYELRNQSVSFLIDGDSDLNLTSYPGLFSQVITNLVNNSIRHGFYRDEGNFISLKFEEQSDKVVIVYRDNGRGIPREFCEEIFKAYFSLDDKSKGSGLGLNICREIVEKSLKGRIRCCSSGDWDGAEFVIEIPGSKA